MFYRWAFLAIATACLLPCATGWAAPPRAAAKPQQKVFHHYSEGAARGYVLSYNKPEPVPRKITFQGKELLVHQRCYLKPGHKRRTSYSIVLGELARQGGKTLYKIPDADPYKAAFSIVTPLPASTHEAVTAAVKAAGFKGPVKFW